MRNGNLSTRMSLPDPVIVLPANLSRLRRYTRNQYFGFGLTFSQKTAFLTGSSTLFITLNNQFSHTLQLFSD